MKGRKYKPLPALALGLFELNFLTSSLDGKDKKHNPFLIAFKFLLIRPITTCFKWS